jgi:phosphoglycolate phosphatase
MKSSGLLIFDLDGTIFQTDSVTVPAVKHGFQNYGLPEPSAVDICSYIGAPVSVYHAWIRSICPEWLASEVITLIDQLEIEYINRTGTLYIGVRDILKALREASFRMAICTNGPKDYVEKVVSTQGIAPYFQIICFPQSEQDDKGRMVKEILSQIHDRPAIMIGDRQEDISSAQNNGLKSIGAMYGFGDLAELACADGLAQFPTDIPHIIRKLTGSNA